MSLCGLLEADGWQGRPVGGGEGIREGIGVWAGNWGSGVKGEGGGQMEGLQVQALGTSMPPSAG